MPSSIAPSALPRKSISTSSAPCLRTAANCSRICAGVCGPNEGTRGIQVSPVAPGTRFDGGPDEGTRGPQAQSYWQQANPRTSYQPAPDEGFKERAGGPRFIPPGPSN